MSRLIALPGLVQRIAPTHSRWWPAAVILMLSLILLPQRGLAAFDLTISIALQRPSIIVRVPDISPVSSSST